MKRRNVFKGLMGLGVAVSIDLGVVTELPINSLQQLEREDFYKKSNVQCDEPYMMVVNANTNEILSVSGKPPLCMFDPSKDQIG